MQSGLRQGTFSFSKVSGNASRGIPLPTLPAPRLASPVLPPALPKEKLSFASNYDFLPMAEISQTPQAGKGLTFQRCLQC